MTYNKSVDDFDKKAFLLPKEASIISNWKSDIMKPVVSICCAAYNHESYIEEAIKGFLIQKTDFPFEILIHDDASTDTTANIIRKYQNKYPKLVKPIYQEENQYSKGKRIMPLIATQCIGEFIAFCEGDDYWYDEFKLQRQYEALLSEPHSNICFTAAFDVDAESKKKKIICYHGDRKKRFSLSEVVRGGGGFMPTASLMIKSKVFLSLPGWLDDAPVGDYYIQILSSIKGGVIYLPLVSCVYRTNSIGSWSQRQKKQGLNQIKQTMEQHILCLNSLERHGVDTEDISYMKAYVIMSRLRAFYREKKDKVARELLITSCRYYQFIDRKQRLMYKLRNYPLIIRLLYKLFDLRSKISV